MEPGEYAMRGGILDLYPPAHSPPGAPRFFGDTLEAIRFFDPASQRTQGAKDQPHADARERIAIRVRR